MKNLVRTSPREIRCWERLGLHLETASFETARDVVLFAVKAKHECGAGVARGGGEGSEKNEDRRWHFLIL